MAEETTTEAPAETGEQTIQGVTVDDQGMAVSEPETTEPAEAVQETTEPEQKETQAEAEPSDEEQLTKFAETKGLTLDSDNAKKAAKMAMEAEKRMHQATSKASELEKVARITDEQVPEGATPQEVDNLRVRNLELKLDIQSWKSNPDNKSKLAYEQEMVKVLADPIKKQLVQGGYLSLDDVYNIARGGDASVDANLKSEGKREALESLAHKQQVAVPTGNAVNPQGGGNAKITPQNVDRLVGQNDVTWYQEHLDEINAAMAG